MVTLKGGDTDQVVGVASSADLDRWVLRIVERKMEVMKWRNYDLKSKKE